MQPGVESLNAAAATAIALYVSSRRGPVAGKDIENSRSGLSKED